MKQTRLGLALGISFLIHLALGKLFITNQSAAGQLKPVKSQGLTISLNTLSTATLQPKKIKTARRTPESIG